MKFDKKKVMLSKNEKEMLKKFGAIAYVLLINEACDHFDCCEDCPFNEICSQDDQNLFKEKIYEIVEKIQNE